MVTKHFRLDGKCRIPQRPATDQGQRPLARADRPGTSTRPVLKSPEGTRYFGLVPASQTSHAPGSVEFCSGVVTVSPLTIHAPKDFVPPDGTDWYFRIRVRQDSGKVIELRSASVSFPAEVPLVPIGNIASIRAWSPNSKMVLRAERLQISEAGAELHLQLETERGNATAQQGSSR